MPCRAAVRGCSQRAARDEPLDVASHAQLSAADGELASQPKENPWATARLEAWLEAWRRMVRSMYRIRRLQRYFGHVGQFLQGYNRKFLTSLQDNLPKT